MYLILGAKTGLANATANICKNVAYFKFDSMKFTVFFAILRIGLLFLGWEGLVTGLFILCEIIALFILEYGSTQQFRILTLFREGVWVVYDVLFATILVALLTVISFSGCLISVIKNKDEE